MSRFDKAVEMINSVCSCGRHNGLGNASPHMRAQMYNWFRNRYPKGYESAYKHYLESYERAHGKLAYDDFLPKVKEAYLAKQPQEQEQIQYWNE